MAVPGGRTLARGPERNVEVIRRADVPERVEAHRPEGELDRAVPPLRPSPGPEIEGVDVAVGLLEVE